MRSKINHFQKEIKIKEYYKDEVIDDKVIKEIIAVNKSVKYDPLEEKIINIIKVKN